MGQTVYTAGTTRWLNPDGVTIEEGTAEEVADGCRLLATSGQQWVVPFILTDGAPSAEEGAAFEEIAIDVTNGQAYLNIGTVAVNVWVQVSS